MVTTLFNEYVNGRLSKKEYTLLISIKNELQAELVKNDLYYILDDKTVRQALKTSLNLILESNLTDYLINHEKHRNKYTKVTYYNLIAVYTERETEKK